VKPLPLRRRNAPKTPKPALLYRPLASTDFSKPSMIWTTIGFVTCASKPARRLCLWCSPCPTRLPRPKNRVAIFFSEPLGEFVAVHFWHADIEEDNFGLRFALPQRKRAKILFTKLQEIQSEESCRFGNRRFADPFGV
jgi:hypothetical protein